uniref:2-keto-4-pentenoate hydratase n=1 Tax=Altererythrobacter segetis TaxID=1104773 RepID=UPI00140B3933|nr:2-keto-4-pentenoate hydratase [Altererythrobacter segetis]
MADDTGIIAARAFVEARRTGRAIADYPGVRPHDLAQAYRVQDAAIKLWQREIGGWKVGRINPPEDRLLGASRLAGPIFADTIVDGTGAEPALPVFADGFAAGEAEFLLRLRVPEGGKRPRGDAETLAWIDQVRIGIEIASSPYAGINADGACVTASDQGNNAGLVLGVTVARERWVDLDAIEVETRIGDRMVGRATAATMLDGPLGAVRFLLDNLSGRGIEPRSGWWISSGAVTGVHPVRPGDRLSARFEGIGEVACTIAR